VSLDLLLSEAFRVFDEVALKYRTFVLAFSGGKDSTATAILFYKWVKKRVELGERHLPRVVLLHNDTLSEIPEMEEWVEEFIRQYKEQLQRLGANVEVKIARPRSTETWYWRVFVRGYPAPTFNFRWCVDMLKIEPTGEALRRLTNYVLIVGARDDESGARAKSMKTRFGSCSGGGSCLGAYFTSSNDIPKAAPIRFWSYDFVWAFLKAQKEFNIDKLIELYKGIARGGSVGGRYGCWHCTLVTRQAANYYREEYLYAEAIRLLYRAISDIGELFRIRKNQGYSRWGPINELGRAILFHAIPTAEELAGKRIFYGLDKAMVGLHTLRKIFYIMSDEDADKLIKLTDPTDRRVPLARLRDLAAHAHQLESAINQLRHYLNSQNHKDPKINNKITEILNRILTKNKN